MNLFQSYSSLIKSSGSGDKVFELLDRSPPAPGTGSASLATTQSDDGYKTKFQNSPASVVLSKIHFHYPSRPDNLVLKNFDLTIPKGKTVALVGASGCGKSTVVSLLQRFYDPTAGSIFVNDRDLRSLDLKEYRRMTGIVTQDPVLFRGTILSNITYGCPEVSREEAQDAASFAHAHNFIMSFPDGYETEVGERGIQLSGGQKQRIAIARAIVKKPALLILDEATSALDAESEQIVQEALDSLLDRRDGMTTVVVAHRLRTIRNADAIAFIENGWVCEVGTHDELLKHGSGKYKALFEKGGSAF